MSGFEPDPVGRALAPGGLSTLFQPLLDLRTSSTVGFEALTRLTAPAAAVAPDRLFALARSQGRAVDLDWACRCHAFDAALGRLGPGQRLFVNAEPQAFDRACPPALLSSWLAGYRRLRVVVELTERDLLEDPAGLLRARATLLELGWELALDDVGANDATVALLPLLRPDIVKLDRALLQPDLQAAKAAALTAVQAYAQQTGAHVVAEGIETAAELKRAHQIGADWAQGFRLGRPGPLPDPTETRPRPAHSPAGSSHRRREHKHEHEHEHDRSGHGDPLLALSRPSAGCRDDQAVAGQVGRILTRAVGAGVGAVLVVCNGAAGLLEGIAPLLDRLSGPCSIVAVLAAHGTMPLTPRARSGPLTPTDPVSGDCGALLLAPDRALAFHARPDGRGGWTCAESCDPGEVADAARALLARVSPLDQTGT